MSKMDNLRAMREARYAQAEAQGRPRSASPSPTSRPRAASDVPVAPARVAPARPASERPALAVVPPAAESAPDEATAPAGEALCGHRNMGGRTCTREQGHAAKSHRYS